MSMRRFWVIVHRWAGLTIALFLCVAGVTGALLSFYDELDARFAPGLHIVASPGPAAPMLDPQTLREQVLARHPGGTIDYLPLHFTPGRSVVLGVTRVDPRTGESQPWSRDWDEIFIDPYTGSVLGHRQWGDIGEGMVNFMPFVYRLHYSLALGDYGLLAFGIASLIWTLDCFVGFYLTFPVSLRRHPGQAPRASEWLTRWKSAWFVRRRRGGQRLVFDLHRATGLWVWPLLLVFAWSAVSFNLAAVYSPVMMLFGYEPLEAGVVAPPEPRYHPKIEFRAAEVVGKRLAAAEVGRLGISMDPSRESGLLHRPDAGIYAYIFSSSADMRREGGRSLVIFDSDSGRLVKVVLPQGQKAANTFTEWIAALHMGSVWGLPWRIAVSSLGLMVTALAITGILIWARRRSAQILVKQRLSASPPYRANRAVGRS
jgi:uncharacterized iron-regulated membrane protein